MKKQFLLFIAATLFSFGSLMAQDGKQKMSPEDRTKMTMEKIAKLNLNDSAKTKAEAIFKDFYQSMSKAQREMREAGNIDREAMKTKREQFAKERDEKLKQVFTAEQFKKWQDEIEPSLRPQRGDKG